ncbi:MAG: hypothetical protein WBR29_03130 [Gammaproteobacteria bacterium]
MTEPYRNLLLGCGTSREKLLGLNGSLSWQGELVTLDRNPNVQPDILFDLNNEEWIGDYGAKKLRPHSFDEIHAYEVLEHLGAQGFVDSFFRDFFQIWRLLKPGGHLFATTPSKYSAWLWGDPGHRRAILSESLIFLDRVVWRKANAGSGPAADYRQYFDGDFHVVETHDDHIRHRFCLRAVNPVRPW